MTMMMRLLMVLVLFLFSGSAAANDDIVPWFVAYTLATDLNATMVDCEFELEALPGCFTMRSTNERLVQSQLDDLVNRQYYDLTYATPWMIQDGIYIRLIEADWGQQYAFLLGFGERTIVSVVEWPLR